MANDFPVRFLIRAIGNLIEGEIRNLRQQHFEPVGEPAFLLFPRLDRRFQLLHLFLEACRSRLVLCGKGLTDILRGRVAPGLSLLQPLHLFAALTVEFQYARGLRFKGAPGEPPVKGIGVFPDPFDVEHGYRSS